MDRKGQQGFPADSRLTRRVMGVWLLLAVIAAGYAALGGVIVWWVTAWPWWLGAVVPAGLIAAMYVRHDRSVLPKHLTTVATGPDQEPSLHAVVDRLCALSGISKPKLKVIEVDWANAVTFQLPGRQPTIAVTRGLLRSCAPQPPPRNRPPRSSWSSLWRRLWWGRDSTPDRIREPSRPEPGPGTSRLEAVLAHELAHIAHRDAGVMAFATALVMGPLLLFALLATLAVRYVKFMIFVLTGIWKSEGFICRLARWCGRDWQTASHPKSAFRPEHRAYPLWSGRCDRPAPWLVAVFLLPFLVLARVAVKLLGLAWAVSFCLIPVFLIFVSPKPVAHLLMVVAFSIPVGGLLMIPASVALPWFARYRELAADRAAAELTGSPAALSAALVALTEGAPTIPHTDLRAVQALSGMTIAPLPERLDEAPEPDFSVRSFLKLDHPWRSWVIWSTMHPPLRQRLDQLAGLSRQLARVSR